MNTSISRTLQLCLLGSVVLMILPDILQAGLQVSLKRVLLLHSYHPGYKWTDDMNQAIARQLNRTSGVDLRIEYLDTKHYATPRYLDEQYRNLSSKYADTTFDLIIASDNHALTFIVDHRDHFFPDIPIVFCGVNFFTQEMLKGATGITGVNENVKPRLTIDMMLRNYPQTKRIIVINDDSITASVVERKIIEISRSYSQIEWFFWDNSSIENLVTRLGALQRGDLVLLSLFFVDTDGRYIEYDEAARLISGASQVPVYVLWDFYLGFGVVGGYLASGDYQGEKAAELARLVLAGTPVSAIPVVQDSPNAYLADYQALQRFSIPKDSFPPTTHFINEPPNFYEDHKLGIWLTIALLAGLSSLSIMLLAAVLKQRQAETELRRLSMELESRVKQRTQELKKANEEILSREEQIRLLLANLPGMAYRCKYDKDWTMLFVSQGVTTLTGYSSAQLLENAEITFADLIDERDRIRVTREVEKAVADGRQFTCEYRIHTSNGASKWVWERGMAVYGDNGALIFIDGFISDISDKKQSEQELIKLATVIQQADDIIIMTDLAGTISYVNPAFSKITGYSDIEARGKNPRLLKSGKHKPEFYEGLWQTLQGGDIWRGRFFNKRKNGSEYVAQAVISPIRDNAGDITGYAGIQQDVSHEVIMENNLRQAQKLEAIGTLAGGIAHEINTPTQYVGNNLDFIADSIADLNSFISACKPLIQDNTSVSSDDLQYISSIYQQSDLDYLLDELPQACRQSRDGIEKISSIVHSMKLFAHPSEAEKTESNLNEALQTTATVCANEWKYTAELTMQLDPDLPRVFCHRSELNQVFLTLIVNAAQAIEASRCPNTGKGSILITTAYTDEVVTISISDDGGGIAEEIQGQVFDPFFTTKAPGKGTGQGLAIAHSIVTEKHGGELYFETQTGRGTTFFIHLPVHPDII